MVVDVRLEVVVTEELVVLDEVVTVVEVVTGAFVVELPSDIVVVVELVVVVVVDVDVVVVVVVSPSSVALGPQADKRPEQRTKLKASRKAERERFEDESCMTGPEIYAS